MRSKRTQKLLDRLNRQVICLTFTDDTSLMEVSDSAVTTYFGYQIGVSFPNSSTEIKRNAECQPLFYVQLIELQDNEFWDYTDSTFFGDGFFTLSEVVTAINQYIRSRPYTILRKKPGIYALLDPLGHLVERDISLARARALCDHNYSQ